MSCNLHLPLSEFLVGLRIYEGDILIFSKTYSTIQHLVGISEFCRCHTLPENYFNSFQIQNYLYCFNFR